MNPFTLRPFRVDVAAIHDWNRRNRKSRRAYHASQQDPRPTVYACTRCGQATRSRTSECPDCQGASA